jgi:hypothetical protein
VRRFVFAVLLCVFLVIGTRQYRLTEFRRDVPDVDHFTLCEDLQDLQNMVGIKSDVGLKVYETRIRHGCLELPPPINIPEDL